MSSYLADVHPSVSVPLLFPHVEEHVSAAVVFCLSGGTYRSRDSSVVERVPRVPSLAISRVMAAGLRTRVPSDTGQLVLVARIRVHGTVLQIAVQVPTHVQCWRKRNHMLVFIGLVGESLQRDGQNLG